MNYLKNRKIIILITSLALCVSALAAAQAPKIEKVPPNYIPVGSGAEMYRQYCATCHGKAGKGDGPAAAALKTPPSSLATLASRHNGKFPTDYVANLLQNGVSTAKAHGSPEMPVWGPLFGSLSGGNKGSPEVRLRISNIINYLQFLQTK